MSSRTVRDEFRQAFDLFSIPYIDTINLRVDKVGLDEWFSASFYSDSNDKMSFCGNQDETGTVEIEIFTEAGIGDGRGLDIASDLALHLDFFMNDNVIVENIDAPEDIKDGDAEGLFYGILLVVNYSLKK